MKNALVGLAVALGALSFSSCSLEPYVITAEEQYMRDFIKKFGLADAEQDWNMAKSEDIKVNVGAGSKHLKLYAKVGNTYYLIADYYNVEGTITIPVDVPEGTRDILAISDGSRYYGTIGSTLDCTGVGSRADGSADDFPSRDEITNDTEKITQISDEPISWIWVVEDLGSTDDFDFNDVVVKIQSVSTNVAEKESEGDSNSQSVNAYKKVTFTPLAAGGALPTYIHWKKAEGKDYVLAPGVYKESEGTSVDSDDTHVIQSLESLNVTTNGGAGAVEYHNWFGDYPYTQMINTGQISVDQSKISTCVIYVDSKFSISGFANIKTIDAIGKGLYISINGPTEGDNTERVDVQRAADTNYNVAAPKIGAPAQMFIIFDNHWAWPVERTHITDAYPLFKDWAGDKKTDWTTERGKGDVIDRQY